MSIMMASLYDALRTAGSSEEQARKAAEEVAAYDNKFAKIEGDLTPVKWMLGFNLAISAGVLLKLLG